MADSVSEVADALEARAPYFVDPFASNLRTAARLLRELEARPPEADLLDAFNLISMKDERAFMQARDIVRDLFERRRAAR